MKTLALASLLIFSSFPIGAAQKIKFKTSDGQTLIGNYAASKPGQPFVVMLHGLGSAKEEWDPFVHALTEKGIGSLAYDARGHGESSLSKDANGVANGYQSFLQRGRGSAWEKMVDDLGSALKYLEMNHQIPRSRIVVAGASIGANIAIQYSGLSSSVSRIIALSPGQNYQDLQPEKYLDRVAGASVLLVASSADGYSFQSCKFFKARWPSLELWTNVKPGHGTQMFDPSLLSRLTAWIALKR